MNILIQLFLFLYMKTFLEFLNNDQEVSHKPYYEYEVGEKLLKDDLEYVCLGEINGKNMFVRTDREIIKRENHTFPWALEKTRLAKPIPKKRVGTGLEQTEWLLKHYEKCIDRTIWGNLQDDEYVPNVEELKEIMKVIRTYNLLYTFEIINGRIYTSQWDNDSNEIYYYNVNDEYVYTSEKTKKDLSRITIYVLNY